MSKPVRGDPRFDAKAAHITSETRQVDEEMCRNMDSRGLDDMGAVALEVLVIVNHHRRIRHKQSLGGREGAKRKAAKSVTNG